jgi:hypothetical protein
MSTWKCSWREERGRRVRLTTSLPTVSLMCRQCGIFDISQPYRPLRPVTGIALLFYAEESRPRLRSSGQSSWLQIQRSGFDSWRYQIFWVVGLERGPLSLVSTTEELLERNCSESGQEIREYGRRDPSHLPRDNLYPQTLALRSQGAVSRSV